MKTNRHCLLISVLSLAAAGCASHSPPASTITGEHSARFNGVWNGDAPTTTVSHTFTLHNRSAAPVTIVSHRTRINTVWHFTDTGDGRLPRTIGPGETIELAVRGRMYKPGEHKFFADLTLDTGEIVSLEMLVDG